MLAPGLGYDWVIKQTSRCIKELAALTAQEGKGLFHLGPRLSPAKVTLGSGDHALILKMALSTPLLSIRRMVPTSCTVSCRISFMFG